jgi:hypothetical protein
MSEPVSIDVESTDTPLSLTVDPPAIPFGSAGEQIPLMVTATFADGVSLDVSESSSLEYTSSDSTVAKVNDSGVVAAVGLGTTGAAAIKISYGPLSVFVPVSVAAATQGEAHDSTDVDGP